MGRGSHGNGGDTEIKQRQEAADSERLTGCYRGSCQSGKKGHGRTRELRQVVNLIAKRCRNDETARCLGWVKSHISDIEGNQAADEEAKKAAEGHTRLGKEDINSSTLITEG